MFPNGETIFFAAENTVRDIGTGDFAKKILVLALEEAQGFANRAFIAKVFSAANLDLSADALLAELPHGRAINCFAGLEERPAYVFSFGIPAVQMGLQAQIPNYEAVEFHGVTWVFADPLSILEPDRDKKVKLWNILKTLFL